ncbi:unnamed protein product, partial [Adineta steineri]
MSKDRIKELSKNTPWPHVTYRRVSQQFRKDDFQNTTNDGNAQCITIAVDNENNVTEFLAQIDLTRLLVDKIQELADETKNIHLKMLAPMADPKLSQQLDDITDDIRKLAYDISTKLKKMEQIQEDQSAAEKASAVWRIKHLQISNITRHFSEVMNQYNQESVLHREKCKNAIKRELAIAGIGKTDDEIEEIIENGFPGTHSFSIMADIQNAKEALNEIEARHRDITKLENSIKELHQMFIDLARLVADQGAMIDNIEHSVSKAVEYVDDATKKVVETRVLHEAATKTPWPHVTYRRVSRQFRKDEFQNTTNDGITQCITIEIDKENDVAEFLAQIDLTRLFVDKIEELANETVQIHFTMLQLAAHSSIQLSQQLDDITDDIRKLAYDVSTKLKKMEQIQEDQNATEKASAVWRIKRLQISNITRHFSEVMNQYNQESVLHRQTCKNIIKRELEMAHIHKTDDEIEEIIENGFPGTHSFSIMTDTKNTEGALNEIEARHREITKLENSLKALHSMFMDLARLLANKDVMTDNIEYNVLKAVEYDDDPAKQ